MNERTNCPFCKRIAAGEYDYEDTWSVAFQPLLPVTPGHFLVVPRKHVAHALESPGSAGKALEFAGYLANQMGLEAANFITSAGLAATQSVFHLHVHVVPRHADDGLVLPWTHQRDELLKLPGAVSGELLKLPGAVSPEVPS
ncbi:MAG: HIT family protein [Candidatus Binataceae bacterium]|jgi:histidine triad (HIT) family protein